MARVLRFDIENFRGIEFGTLLIEGGKPAGSFVTLIGLNESGKTTLLEALSHSVLADPGTSDLMESVQGTPELNDLIPKKKKAAFTGTVSVKAYVELEAANHAKLRHFLVEKHNLVVIGSIPTRLTVTKTYYFKDSTFERSTNNWDFDLSVKRRAGKKELRLDFASMKDEWVSTVLFVKTLLPQVIYFPTFMVEFPRRIYLEGQHGEVDSYYRQVMDDAMRSLKPPLSVSTHILERVEKHREPNKSFSSSLRASPEGQQIDATVQSLSAELNRVIFGAWNEIFGKKLSGHRINVEWHVDESVGNHVYLEVSITSEDHLKFYVSERSLGFRWFFSFLLFTQFQSFRADRERAIFLFDEPASHLHARAQQRLLDSFVRIAEPSHIIVYSTHSHYLINPLWLEKAYIVTNEAIDIDDDDPLSELVDSGSRIRLTKYPQFVSENPTKLSYFQPVLDALDYRFSELVMNKPMVLLEGKYDFYPMKYFLQEIGQEGSISIFPATGAGGMATLIALARGLGLPFVIFLDDDKEGKKEKRRYKEEFLLTESEVMTIADFDPSFAKKDFEDLFKGDVRDKVGLAKPTKKDFYSYFQTLVAGGGNLIRCRKQPQRSRSSSLLSVKGSAST